MMERKKAAAAAAARSDSAPADPAPQLMHSYNALTQTWSSAPQEQPQWTFEPALPDAAYGALDFPADFPDPPPFDFGAFAMDQAFSLPPAPGPAPPHFDTPRDQAADGHAYAYSHLIAERAPSPPPRAGSPTPPPPPITPATSTISSVPPADESPPRAPESGPELSASLALLSMAASAPAAPAPAAHYRAPSARAAGKGGKPLRLDAHLAVTDECVLFSSPPPARAHGQPSPSVRPYACGYPACWDAAAGASSACAPTSAALAEHVRAAHGAAPLAADAKPFRCALPGCGKAWKVRPPAAHPPSGADLTHRRA
jgi:hypothetical protein